MPLLTGAAGAANLYEAEPYYTAFRITIGKLSTTHAVHVKTLRLSPRYCNAAALLGHHDSGPSTRTSTYTG